MRVVISGDLIAVRYVQLKDVKVGYFEVLQYGNENYPSEVVNILCTSIPFAKGLQIKFDSLKNIKATFYCNLVSSKEIIVEYLELLDLKGEEIHDGD